MSIPLSQEHGINPALTVCPRCKGPASELILAGNSIKWRCDKCGQNHVAYAGQSSRMECPCGNKYRNGRHFTKIGKFDGGRDRAIASEPCEKCRAELEEHAKIVEAGGIYFQCDCGSSGVVKAEVELAKAVREQHIKMGHITAPEEGQPHQPCGIQLNTCPACEEQPGDMLAGESGASAVEYGILVAAVAAVIIGVMMAVGGKVETAFNYVANTMPW